MKYDFDKIMDRTATESLKWIYPRKVLKVEDAIPLWVADMDFEAPKAVTEALCRRAEHGIFGYPLLPPSLYGAAIDWLKRRHGWETKKEWFCITPGVVAALHYCVRAFTRPGDGVVIQTPVYPPFYHAVNHQERRVIRNPLRFDGRRYTMDFEDLEKKIDGQTRLLILCSPHNPVGRVWTHQELETLAQIAIRHDLLIVSDEIHHDLVYRDQRHTVLASLSEEIARRTITCIAPSKTFNIPGLSTAAVITPDPDFHKKLEREVKLAGFELGQIFGIVGFEAAYTYGEEWLEALLPYLEENVLFLEQFLADRIPDIRLIRPEGTYLALLDCRGLDMDPATVHDFFLRQAHVYFSEGKAFGRELEGYVRINFGCPRVLLREALERIERAVHDFSGGR